MIAECDSVVRIVAVQRHTNCDELRVLNIPSVRRFLLTSDARVYKAVAACQPSIEVFPRHASKLMARYSLFVLKVPLNPKQTNKQTSFKINLHF